jgi:hypothetical protein
MGIFSNILRGAQSRSGVFGMAGSNIWGKIPAGAKNYLGGAARGAAVGWGASMLGGAFMGGDQSQLGGIGVGAALGALGRHPGISAFRSKQFAGRLGAPGRYASSWAEGAFGRGAVGNRLPNMWESSVRGSVVGGAALIGSTVLESNQPVNRF